jgi:hypothetical protein
MCRCLRKCACAGMSACNFVCAHVYVNVYVCRYVRMYICVREKVCVCDCVYVCVWVCYLSGNMVFKIPPFSGKKKRAPKYVVFLGGRSSC